MKKTICAVTAAMLALTSVLCGCSSNGESSSQSGSTTSATVATDTTVKATGEKIHINDSTLGEIWITELDGVPKNTLNNDNFTSDDTFKYYSENGKAASMEGIDISSYSGKIDWDKVKKSGLHINKSEHINAPVIEESPITLECRVEEIRQFDQTLRIIAEITDVLVDDSIELLNGHLDISRANIASYDPDGNLYYRLGDEIGHAFLDGKQLM